MSDSPFPKTITEAVPYVVWGILVFTAGFEGIASLLDGNFKRCGLAFLLMAVLIALALYWPQLTNSKSVTTPTILIAVGAILILAGIVVMARQKPEIQSSSAQTAIEDLIPSQAPKEEKPLNDPTKPPYSIGNVTGSGNIVTQGQTGGQNIINQAPKPEFERSDFAPVRNPDGTYRQSFLITVKADTPPMNVLIGVRGPGINNFNAVAPGSMVTMLPQEGNSHFIIVSSPSRCRIFFTTVEENSQFEYNVIFNYKR